MAIVIVFFLGCTQHQAAEPPVRPVRVFRVSDAATARQDAFAGEIRARYETKLSFRVPGKVVARRVEVGERVRKGQPLARIDPLDYQLASKALASQLSAARTERDFARDDLTRYRELLEQKFISKTDYDRADTRYTTARDRVEGLEAQLAQANNQTSYTELHADRDGIVTALPVEAGQVVTAGQSVVVLAQIDDKEVVINVPEQRIAEVRGGSTVDIVLWANDSRRLKGRVREIAPAADPASRTYAVKLSLLEQQDEADLGMTATVYFPARTVGEITIPLSAVYQSQTAPGATRVWVVDDKTLVVRSLPVKVGLSTSAQRVVTSGLTVGQLIVSAGANRLTEGQKVRLLGDKLTEAQLASVPLAAASAPRE